MPRQTATLVEIVDRLKYACYKFNRGLGVTQEDFCLMWGKVGVAQMERKYQEEVAGEKP